MGRPKREAGEAQASGVPEAPLEAVAARARRAPQNPTGVNGYCPTAAEHEERLRELETAMLMEGSDRKAARRVHRMLLGHDPETAPKYVTVLGWCAEIRQRWREDAEREGQDREALKREHRARFMLLVQKGLADGGQRRVALMAAERVAQLDGFLTNRVEVTGKDGGPVQVSAAKDIMEALARAAAAAADKPPPDGCDTI